MAHALAFLRETDADAVFGCSACGVEIGFNKPGVGEPAAIAVKGGGWLPPENADLWMGPCAAEPDEATLKTVFGLWNAGVSKEEAVATGAISAAEVAEIDAVAVMK